MVVNGSRSEEGAMNAGDEEKIPLGVNSFCRNHIRGGCSRENCRFIHEIPPKSILKDMFRFCHDYQNKGCFRHNCKFIHTTVAEEDNFYSSGKFPKDPRFTPVCQAFLQRACMEQDCKFIHPLEILNNEPPINLNLPPPSLVRPNTYIREDDSPPDAKLRRYNLYPENNLDKILLPSTCSNCDNLEHKVELLHDNISVLLKKVSDLSAKNAQLTSMNEFLLEQTATLRSEQPCVITSRHGGSAPVSLATVSMTPVVSLAGTLVPAGAPPSLTLAPAASRAQLLTPAPQLITVSTTQQLMGNSGTLIVTSAGQQLMQVSDSGTLIGGGQVVAVTPAQLTLAPSASQLVQSPQYAASSATQLVAQTNPQQITISSANQQLTLPNSQAQPITFPIISQSILPH